MAEWRGLLAAAVRAASRAQVARDLGVSRTAVSLLASGKYPGSTERMAARVMEKYGAAACPYLGRTVTPEECRRNGGEMPTASPDALRLWRTCQGCEHNPHKESV